MLMKINYFMQTRHHRSLGWLLLLLLVLLPGLRAYGATFTYEGLSVTTDGTEGTDYTKADNTIRILTSQAFTFSATSTLVQIVVGDGVTNAQFTLAGYTCGRTTGSSIVIGKGASATITLAEGTSSTINGGSQEPTMLIDDNATVTINGTGSLTANASQQDLTGRTASIQLSKTAKLIVASGTLTATTEKSDLGGEGAAIGGKQYGEEEACGTLQIDGGTVTLNATGANAAAFGGGSGNNNGFENPNGRLGGTLIMNGGKLVANGRIGGGNSCFGANGTGGAGGAITIAGGEVESTMDLGSAPNAAACGSITLQGGKLTTPSMTMADNKVTIVKTATLVDDFTTTLPVTVSDNITLTVGEGANFNVATNNLTLGTGASFKDLNVPELENGCYSIASVAQLKWFRKKVNGEGNVEQDKAASAKLANDLDLSGEPWQPIADYSGTFDGNYHTVSNLKIANATSYAGLFAKLSGGTIKNLGVIKADISGVKGAAGVIAGVAEGNSTIANCYSADTLTFSNCSKTSGIAACQGNATIKNCYTSYSIVSADESTGVTSSQAELSADSYNTGELAYLLNTNKASGETGWGQEVGTDTHPMALGESNQVYKHGSAHEATNVELLPAKRMATVCYPVAVKLPDHVKMFELVEMESVTSSDKGLARMQAMDETTIPAHTPVVLVNGGDTKAVINLPAISGYYDNSSESAEISQDGNLLRGTYGDDSDNTAKLVLSEGEFKSGSASAYECYVVKTSDMTNDSYLWATTGLCAETDFAVLSESDNTCYLKSLFVYGNGKKDQTVELPETVEIKGKDYTVAQFGCCNKADDQLRFGNLTSENDAKLYIMLSEKVTTVSKQATIFGSNNTYLRFDTTKVPTFSGAYNATSAKPQILVPYGAETAYINAWGDNGAEYIKAEMSEVDLAKGDLNIWEADNQVVYTLAGGEETKVNGTLVITSSEKTSHTIKIGGPCSIAFKNLNLDNSTSEDNSKSPVDLDECTVGVVLIGENTITAADGVDCIDFGYDGSLYISELSTGTLNVSKAISSRDFAVPATVYNGTSESTINYVHQDYSLDYNALAFTKYDLVSDMTNLVVNDTCEDFSLIDGENFYSPSAFTATKMSYWRRFQDNDFNALYLPFSASVDDFADCEFYEIKGLLQSGNNLSLEVSKLAAGTTLEANSPYLFKYTGDTSERVQFELENVGVVETPSSDITSYPSADYLCEFAGNYQSVKDEDLADSYVIGIDDTTGKTALVKTTTTLPAMRWAMKITSTSAASAPATLGIVVDGDGSTTGIDRVNATNGGNTAVYGLDGVRKSQMTKGVNIVKTAGGKTIKVVK